MDSPNDDKKYNVIEIDDEEEEEELPGFRFHPTDEELVGFYLRRKVQKKPLSIDLIKPIDIYKYDPWDLPSMPICSLYIYFIFIYFYFLLLNFCNLLSSNFR